MSKEVILVVLNEFADWEGAFIAPALNAGTRPGRPIKYKVKTLSLTKAPVVSIGGITLLPDYDLQTMPADYAGIILVGGTQWFTPEAQQLVPLVETAIKDKKIVGAICNASVFLGINGFLNNVKHTSNTLEFLKEFAGTTYWGAEHYINEQAVRDNNIVTANGTGYLEFCKEVLFALDADSADKIEEYYSFNKLGLCETLK